MADATGTIPAEAEATLTLYPELEANATQATVVVGSKSYAIAIAAGAEQNSLLGRMYTLSGEKIGGTNPGSEQERMVKERKRLCEFAEGINNGTLTGEAQNFTLTEDIDLTGIAWTPIGRYGKPYKGIFDGGGHTITGLTINSTERSQGFFGTTDNGTVISNIHLRGVNIVGGNKIGALVGENYGSIIQCSATGSIKGGEHTGGLVGVNYGTGTITACYATGNVEGSNHIGGLIGGNDGTIAACYATSNVVGNGIGGLVGNNFGAITACYATGNIEGSNAGALVGNNLGICNYNNANGKVNGTVAYDNLIGNNSNYIPIGNSSYLQDKVFEIYNFTLTANGVNDTWPATVKIAVTNADGTVSAKDATIDKKEIWNQTDLSLNRDAIKVVP
ncbi:GLUG motif-containing protein [Bacteroides sp. 519]|uniref:GLUG motif-containing protein n=1 Tax=Bacteroides sp. 519 TaxID=2302937 RepID=UPI0013D1DC33